MPLDLEKESSFDYEKGQLIEVQAKKNPFEQFECWYADIKKSNSIFPNAMVLATVNPSAAPSQRVVLLKEVLEDGFVFYTNYSFKEST